MSSCFRLIGLLASLLFAWDDAAANWDQVRAPMGELPPHLQFRDGEVSFVADYGGAQSGLVAVYIVNATDHPVSFRVAPLIIRETLGDDGTWRRCDLYVPPFCGFGLHEERGIPAGAFYKIIRRLDSESGERRPVRFREFPVGNRSGPVSNVGEGRVDPEETRLASLDVFSVYAASFEELMRIAGEEAAPNLGINTRRIAITRLAEYMEHPRRVTALKEVMGKAVSQGDVEAYASALEGLKLPSPPDWTEPHFWRLASDEVFSRDEPFALAAYTAVQESSFEGKAKRDLLERIIAKRGHPLLSRALADYAKVAGKPATLSLLKKHPHLQKLRDATERDARSMQDGAGETRSLAVEARATDADALGGRALAVTVKNLSAEPISLHGSDPRDLVTIRAFVAGHTQEIPARDRAASRSRPRKTTTLRPAETLTLSPVHWWEFVKVAKVPANASLRLTVRVRALNFWDQPSFGDSEVEIPASAVNAARDLQRHYVRPKSSQ